MKKTIIMSVFACSFILTACGESNDVPEAVTKAFNQKFAAVKNVKWEMEKENEWEAEFKMDGKEYSANFTSDGEWLETEHEIEEKESPIAVKATLARDFKGYDIEESEMSETLEGEFYEFELEADEYTVEVSIDENGNVINKEVKEENDDD